MDIANAFVQYELFFLLPESFFEIYGKSCKEYIEQMRIYKVEKISAFLQILILCI